MPTPGATMSGLALYRCKLGPRELKGATESSARLIVPLWLEAPTVRTHGAFPGAVIAAVLRLSLRVAAEISGGRYDDDAGFHRPLRGQRQRIGRIRLVHTRRHRQIDHADIELGAMLDRVVDRRDHVADVARTRRGRAP